MAEGDTVVRITVAPAPTAGILTIRATVQEQKG